MCLSLSSSFLKFLNQSGRNFTWTFLMFMHKLNKMGSLACIIRHKICIIYAFSPFLKKFSNQSGLSCTWTFLMFMHKLNKIGSLTCIIQHKICIIYAFSPSLKKIFNQSGWGFTWTFFDVNVQLVEHEVFYGYIIRHELFILFALCNLCILHFVTFSTIFINQSGWWFI